MSFITDGLTWHQTMRHQHCTVDAYIGLTLETRRSIKITPTKSETDTTQNRVIQQKQVFHFVVRRIDLISTVLLQRGLKIWYVNDTYELLYDKRAMTEYNDPHRTDVILRAIMITDSESLTPSYNGS